MGACSSRAPPSPSELLMSRSHTRADQLLTFDAMLENHVAARSWQPRPQSGSEPPDLLHSAWIDDDALRELVDGDIRSVAELDVLLARGTDRQQPEESLPSWGSTPRHARSPRPARIEIGGFAKRATPLDVCPRRATFLECF